ncbi:MAG: GFA family protein [Steroidobacteraceae bacterium]
MIACHCSQCRRTSGHHSAMTSAPNDRLSLTSAATLVWFRSSASAERGFCGVCGSNLFWRPRGELRTSITAGTLDLPTHIAMVRHIFIGEKSDYYEIEDGLPKMAGWE